VVVAVDLPLHGITNQSDALYATGANPLYAGLGLPASGSIERTFDFSTVPGVIDPSGLHFINLASLLTRATTCARASRISSRSPARCRT